MINDKSTNYKVEMLTNNSWEKIKYNLSKSYHDCIHVIFCKTIVKVLFPYQKIVIYSRILDIIATYVVIVNYGI